MGSGNKTIILLPGFGVALPSADFGPLMRELSKKHTVVCVEYPGTGFSGPANTPRTNENYTEETRTALSLAGFKPPYLLMPHSASGIYSEYYAQKYPGELSGIIMLDTTSTGKQVSGNPPGFIYTIGKIQQASGLTRLAYALVKSPQKIENGYTAREINDYKKFACHVLNDTIIDQSLRMIDNINEVTVMAFPRQIPVLKLISSQTEKAVGAQYQAEHMNRLGSKAESKVIDSSHFMYQTNVRDICESSDAFLGKIK
jgi:pimeloyl-ACP methyl ester carboxylesterase